MVIALTKFVGIAPRIADNLLPDNAATIAKNCKLFSGSLVAYDGLTSMAQTLDGGTVSLYRKKSTGAWVDFTYDTDVVRSPVRNDSWDRVYYTDANASNPPQMGVSESFTTTYKLGLPAPSSKPTATADGTASSSDPLLAETRAYVVTYVSAYGEEGPPCAVSSSDFVTVYPGEHVDLTSIPVAPAGNYNVTTKNIYRTNTGSQSTDFQLVANIAVATTSYADTTDSADLGVVLPSTDWDAPPATMEGLCAHPAGFLVGFDGREVCLSEQYLPHAWPVANKYPVDSDIVAVAVFGNSILVMTERLPYILTGNDPVSMYLEKPESGFACTSKRGVVDFGDIIVYPSAQGLVAVGVGTPPTLLTNDIMDESDWAAYGPTTINAYRLDDKYFAVTPSGPQEGFVFDTQTKSFVQIDDQDYDAGYFDETEGNLYLKKPSPDTDLYKWDSNSGSKMTYTWRSKQFVSKEPVSFACCQVFADAYTATTVNVKVYADGALVHTEASVASETPFRLPAGTMARKWNVEIYGTNTVNAVHMATSMRELRGV